MSQDMSLRSHACHSELVLPAWEIKGILANVLRILSVRLEQTSPTRRKCNHITFPREIPASLREVSSTARNV